MTLNDFVKSIYSKTGKYGNVVAVSSHYDHQIVQNDEGNYYVDGVMVEAKLHDLEEVKQYVDLQKSANETRIKLYEDISDIRIAGIIKKHYNTKITTKLVESYLDLASSKTFTIDPVLLEMRLSYRNANLVENKLDFRLNDGKQIAINEETVKKIVELLNSSNDKEEILDYMRENVKNFLSVVRQI
jgi:hypothetical protein